MRILIGLIGHMGDIIACEPVARYLKTKHPDAHLSWAVTRPFRELIDTNPFVDETIELGCITDWIRLSKHSDYDEIVDLHVNFQVCRCCKVPLIKKSGNPCVSTYNWLDFGTLLEAFSHGAGLPVLSEQPKMYLSADHVAAVDELSLPADFCVVHLTSNDVHKDWLPAKWDQLSTWILKHLNIPVIEVGAGKNLPPSPLTTGCISLVNKLSILETAEVIRRARFYVGIDSGPAHMANALEVPSVIMLGSLFKFKEYMPYNGFFASSSPLVKIVLNLAGPASDLTVDAVKEAVSQIADASLRRDPLPPSNLEMPAHKPNAESMEKDAVPSWVIETSVPGNTVPELLNIIQSQDEISSRMAYALAEVEQQLNAILSSKSWRVTLWLKKIASWFRVNIS